MRVRYTSIQQWFQTCHRPPTEDMSLHFEAAWPEYFTLPHISALSVIFFTFKRDYEWLQQGTSARIERMIEQNLQKSLAGRDHFWCRDCDWVHSYDSTLPCQEGVRGCSTDGLIWSRTFCCAKHTLSDSEMLQYRWANSIENTSNSAPYCAKKEQEIVVQVNSLYYIQLWCCTVLLKFARACTATRRILSIWAMASSKDSNSTHSPFPGSSSSVRRRKFTFTDITHSQTVHIQRGERTHSQTVHIHR